MLKDDVFTIPLPGSNIILTQHLYLKKEVILYLILDILQRKDSAIYWACELFHSGFKIELFEILWKIYYNFFASLNPSYEAYLFNKHILVIQKQETCEKHIATIVRDFLLRPYNIDVFLLKTYNETFENNVITSPLPTDIEKWVQKNDYVSIALYILNNKDKQRNFDIYNQFLDVFAKTITFSKSMFIKNYQKIACKNNICENTLLLAKIMSLFQKKNCKTTEKKKYALIDEDDIKHLNNDVWSHLPSWKILRFARISNDKEPRRHFGWVISHEMKKQIKDILHSDNQWLYHASFSPLWYDRIKKHRGFVNHLSMCVEFVDEEHEDAFRQHFDYEPDEQPYNLFGWENELADDVNDIELNSSWKSFYNLYNQKGLVHLDEQEFNELVKSEFPFL